MFSIAKLSRASQDFVNEITSNNQTRSKAMSLALARVLNRTVSVPSTPVEDPVGLYRAQTKINSDMKINTINEVIVLDVDTVMDYCMKFYMYRYNNTHPSRAVLAFNKETAIEDFFNISRSFDKETLEVVKEDPIKIVRYINGLETLMLDLFPEVKDEAYPKEG